jgi:hypothetical protein
MEESKRQVHERKKKQEYIDNINTKKINRLRNELQQEHKTIIKENTSLAKTKRIKKKTSRKGGKDM